MAKEPPQTIGDLRRKFIVTDAENAAAVEAYLSNPETATFEFASGHVLDLTCALNAHRKTKTILAEKGRSEAFRRTMVRVAAILATPSAK